MRAVDQLLLLFFFCTFFFCPPVESQIFESNVCIVGLGIIFDWSGIIQLIGGSRRLEWGPSCFKGTRFQILLLVS